MREMLATSIDRRERVIALCEKVTDAKLIVKLSNEIRQLKTEERRILRGIKTDVPQPESLTTIKARRANIRWAKERERNAAS
jgi:hypothetical protein